MTNYFFDYFIDEIYQIKNNITSKQILENWNNEVIKRERRELKKLLESQWYGSIIRKEVGEH